MSSGGDFMKKLRELGIDPGKLDVNVFNSWFDTNDEGTLDFLRWFCTNIGPDNLISRGLQEEYNEMTKKGTVLEGQKLQKAVDELKNRASDIFKLEENKFEIELMRKQKEMLQEVLAAQSKSIKQAKEFNKQMDKKIVKEMDKSHKLQVDCEISEKKCKELAEGMEETHNELHKQMNIYCDNLQTLHQPDLDDKLMFINGASMEKVNECLQYQQIASNIQLLLKRVNLRINASLEMSEEDSLDALYTRLSETLCEHSMNKLKEVKLNAELEYMQDVRAKEMDFENIESVKVELEANLLAKKMELDNLVEMLIEELNKAAKNKVDKRKFQLAETKLDLISKNMEHLEKADEYLTKAIAYQSLYKKLLEKEKEDICKMEQFMKDIENYTGGPLEETQRKIPKMLQVMSEHEEYTQLPIEDKMELINLFKTLLDDNCSKNTLQTLTTILYVITNIRKKCQEVREININNELEEKCTMVKNQIASIKCFLSEGGPTKAAVTFPYKLKLSFKELEAAIRRLKESLEFDMKALTSSEVNAHANKWGRILQQLWTLFLTKPEELLRKINELQDEAKTQWMESIKD